MRPTRTVATGPSKGQSVSASAAEAAVPASTSVSFCSSWLQDEALDLHLVDEAVGEQRADRAIDHPHGQDFLLVGRALRLRKPPGNLPAATCVSR